MFSYYRAKIVFRTFPRGDPLNTIKIISNSNAKSTALTNWDLQFFKHLPWQFCSFYRLLLVCWAACLSAVFVVYAQWTNRGFWGVPKPVNKLKFNLPTFIWAKNVFFATHWNSNYLLQVFPGVVQLIRPVRQSNSKAGIAVIDFGYFLLNTCRFWKRKS